MASVKTIFSEDVFQSAANFSHARIFNGLVYAAGQIPLDKSGELAGSTIEEQTEKVVRNHAAILATAGSGLDHILRINVYLVDPEDYSGFSATYAKMIPDPKPPRGCIFVKSLPAGAKVEMDLVAAVKRDG